MRLKGGTIGTVTITGSIDVNEIGGNLFDSTDATTVGNTATIIAGALAGRKEVMLKASKANTEDIYIGDASITNPGVTENGVPLSPGEAMTLDTTAAIYAVSLNGGQTVYKNIVAYL